MDKEPLSNFVKYKQAVDNINFDDEINTLYKKIRSTLDTITERDIFDGNELSSTQNRLDRLSNELNDKLKEIKKTLDNYLSEKERSYLSKSYELYEESKHTDYNWIKERAIKQPVVVNPEIEKKLIHDISENCSWKYPGMILRPNYFNLAEKMISLDPLYIVEEDLSLLDDIKSKWNKQYQQRLRYVLIDEAQEKIFNRLPKGQLGFVYINDYFNYKPLDVIRKYCIELYDILRPGGKLLFTYNNCDLPNAVKNFENCFYQYTPAKLMIPMIESLGFTNTKKFDDYNTNTNWVEFKKLGKLESIRGGQSLRKVILNKEEFILDKNNCLGPLNYIPEINKDCENYDNIPDGYGCTDSCTVFNSRGYQLKNGSQSVRPHFVVNGKDPYIKVIKPSLLNTGVIFTVYKNTNNLEQE